MHSRRRVDQALGAIAAAVLALSGSACRRDRAARPSAPQARHLTLVVASGPGVSPALPALVRLVADQELRRGGLHRRGKAAPTGVLMLTLERRRSGTNRLSLQLFLSTRGLKTRFDFGRCCAPAHVAELRRQIRTLVATVAPRSPKPSPPLWLGCQYTRDQLHDALAAGVHWLQARAQRTGAFELSDLQQVFLILRESARDPALRRLATRVGPILARRFRRLVPLPRANTPTEQLYDHAAGTYFSQRFGVTVTPRYRRALETAFRTASPRRLLRRTSAADPARDLLDDLVDLYFPFKLGLPMPIRYADVVTRAARYPFGNPAGETLRRLEDRIYLATHIVYVLSGFNESGLREVELRRVVQFLEQTAPLIIAADDVETLGEVGDALKIVGRDYTDPLVRRIVRRLLRHQNPDGSWGNTRDKDKYRRYHTTWTCFNGLLEYRFSKRGTTDPTIRKAWRRGYTPPTRLNPYPMLRVGRPPRATRAPPAGTGGAQ